MTRRAGSERNMAVVGMGTNSPGLGAARPNTTGIGPSTTTTTNTGGINPTTSSRATQDATLADLTRLEMLVQGLLVKTRLAGSTAGLSIAEIMRLSLSGGEDEAAAVEFLKMAIAMDGRGDGQVNPAKRPGNGNEDVVMVDDAGAAHGVNGNGNMPPPLPANWQMDGAGGSGNESDSSVDWDEWLHMEKLG
jgi:hypothetical protein